MTTRRFIAAILVACHGMAGCAIGPSSRAATPDDSPLASLSWLSGRWASEPDDRGVITEEHWMPPRGGSMIGMNRTTSTDQTIFFEFLRIESREDGVYYLASPAGRHPPTPFRLIETGSMMANFENPAHDFPQRILYERRGDELVMEASGMVNGALREERWVLHRATRPERIGRRRRTTAGRTRVRPACESEESAPFSSSAESAQ